MEEHSQEAQSTQGFTPLPLADAVQTARVCQNFFQHCTRIYDAGMTILSAQQSSEEMLLRRENLNRDLSRLQSQLQDLTAELEQARRDFEAEKRRYQQELSALSSQQVQQRATMGQEFDQWKAEIEAERTEKAREHAAALKAMTDEERTMQEGMQALRAEFAQLRERVQQIAG